MKRSMLLGAALLALATPLVAGLAVPAPVTASSAAPVAPQVNRQTGLAEADALLARSSRDYGRPSYSEARAVRFSPDDNVFLKSALAVDFTYMAANVTLPLFRGLGPDGQPVHYIITEASDFEVARRLGVNYAPKMRHAAGSPGEQRVTIRDGVVQFKGAIDFSPEFRLVPGTTDPFPPSVATPGAVADAEWSSMVVMPSGVVLNMQVVANASGKHDRANSVDTRGGRVVMQLLDGFQGGEQYYYHLVTDVSADVPSVLEKGVWAPRIGRVPGFGQSTPSQNSALLGFAPIANGISELAGERHQGFVSTVVNSTPTGGGIDPINVFPLDPDNSNASLDNNYSPMWDAHVVAWTPAAMAAGKVRRVTSLTDLAGLVRSGDIVTLPDAPAGPGNPFISGIRPLGVVINCPVIAQPKRSPRRR